MAPLSLMLARDEGESRSRAACCLDIALFPCVGLAAAGALPVGGWCYWTAIIGSR